MNGYLTIDQSAFLPFAPPIYHHLTSDYYLDVLVPRWLRGESMSGTWSASRVQVDMFTTGMLVECYTSYRKSAWLLVRGRPAAYCGDWNGGT